MRSGDGPDMKDTDLVPVIFFIHQGGGRADGGIRSITEIIGRSNGLEKFVVTNLRSPAARAWSQVAKVGIWPMVETQYGERRLPVFGALNQNLHRFVNNVRAYFLVRKTGAKVVHLNDHRAFWSAALGAKLAGAKLIFNVRDTMREGARSQARWRKCLRLCDMFLVLSQDMIDRWSAALRPTSQYPEQKEKFRFLYSIVDQDEYSPATPEKRALLRQDLGVSATRPLLVYAARFEEKKAQLAFIRNAAPEIRARHPDIAIHFVGDFEPAVDPYAAACLAAVAELELGKNVHFSGFSARTNDWYRAADIVLLGSLREGLPRCLIEGISCGAPVVSFSISSAHEILTHHDCGVVVESGDYAGLAGEVASLLNDPTRSDRYRVRGPAVARELFDAQKNAAHYVRIAKGLAG